MQNFASLLLAAVVALSWTVTTIEAEYVNKDIILTGPQLKAFQAFKKEVLPLLTDEIMKKDLYLVKWLQARNFNVKAAVEFLKQDLKWRKEENMDIIQYEDWSDMVGRLKYSLEPKDKMGRPILYFDVSEIDLRQEAVKGNLERVFRYATKAVDEGVRLVMELSKTNSNVTRGTLLLNLQGFNVVQHGCVQCVPFIIRLISLYEQHYPLFAYRLMTANTPTSFIPLFNILKRFLSPPNLEAVRIYGTNKEQYLRKMDADGFDINELPVETGGKKILKIYQDVYNFDDYY